MNPTQRLLGLALMLGLATGLATGANAAIFTEIGDASNVFAGGANPQAVGSGINQINGRIGSGDEGDLFRVTFATGGTLTIQTSGSVPGGIDTELFLFGVTGAGIAANDDAFAGTRDSRIVVAIVPGAYYIGIGDFDTRAVDTDLTPWDTGAPPSVFGTLNDIRNITIVNTGNYQIALSIETGSIETGGASVPEPTALGLLGAGLFGLGAMARRRRAAR